MCFADWKRLRKVVIGNGEVCITRNCLLHVVWCGVPDVVWAAVLGEVCLTEVLVLRGPERMVQSNRGLFLCQIFLGLKREVIGYIPRTVLHWTKHADSLILLQETKIVFTD